MDSIKSYFMIKKTGPSRGGGRFITAVVAAILLFLTSISSGAFAAPGGNPGAPGGGGSDAATDYGDLLILYRGTNGVPIPSPATLVENPETGALVDGGLCWQPIAFDEGDACPDTCVIDSVPSGTAVVAVDQFNCAVEVGCSACTQEADFGRTNVARTSEAVFDAQLEDVLVKLATSDCATLDPAGRMVASTNEEGVVTSSTIDSPLQSLAIYRQLMLTGSIGVTLPQGASLMDTAARGIGTSFDKGGEVNVDVVAYVNLLLGLSDPATNTVLDPKICETYREEVAGQIQLVEKCFLNYGAYGYTRANNFSTTEQSLPSPSYIPDENAHGWFEYLYELAVPATFGIQQGPIVDAVFAGDGGEYMSDIGGFAQAADDTRAVINYMHNWAVPDAYVTGVPCEASGVDGYDLSISDVSGLQVPVRIIDGSSDREFSVTVVNNGPDDAVADITVTAMVGGEHVSNSPWTWMGVAIGADASVTMMDLVPINIGERATIDWTAVVESEFDANPGNNTATATSSVKVTGGGGGGGPK